MFRNTHITTMIAGTIIGTFLIAALAFAVPRYKVYSLELAGKAKLKEAEWEKKVLIEEAKAKKDSARLLAEAEVERAKGVAEANEIIGMSLEENEEYLHYLWIQGLQDGSSEVIYVPTEAGIPLMEAGKRVIEPPHSRKK